jgi:hypothetical protein
MFAHHNQYQKDCNKRLRDAGELGSDHATRREKDARGRVRGPPPAGEVAAVAAKQHTRRNIAPRDSQEGAEAEVLTAAPAIVMMARPCSVPGESRTGTDLNRR